MELEEVGRIRNIETLSRSLSSDCDRSILTKCWKDKTKKVCSASVMYVIICVETDKHDFSADGGAN